MEYLGHAYPLITTFLGLISLYLLLDSNTKVWIFTGFFIGLFWFWWVALSFIHYHMLWAIPIVVIAMGLLYATLFALISYTAEKINTRLTPHSSLLTLLLKALGLLTLSYIHPFGFDWFKPELMFVNSYLGIEKWQFAIILLSIVVSLWRQQLFYLIFILLAYQPGSHTEISFPPDMELVTLHTPVEEKWDKHLHSRQFKEIFQIIDHAIETDKKLVILPESVFPIFLNYDKALIARLKQKAKKITIIVGGLYWDGKTPHNSTYIFTQKKITIANKVLLVPFGESNPLPDFLSDWVNKVFYDGAVDYQASENVVDYTLNGVTYRNAICFEATSEKLYEKNAKGERPKQMIVLSNNGWFSPSTEPTIQRLLLQYYNKKYGTTIYHAVNMSPSYMLKEGKILLQ